MQSYSGRAEEGNECEVQEGPREIRAHAQNKGWRRAWERVLGKASELTGPWGVRKLRVSSRFLVQAAICAALSLCGGRGCGEGGEGVSIVTSFPATFHWIISVIQQELLLLIPFHIREN